MRFNKKSIVPIVLGILLLAGIIVTIVVVIKNRRESTPLDDKKRAVGPKINVVRRNWNECKNMARLDQMFSYQDGRPLTADWRTDPSTGYIGNTPSPSYAVVKPIIPNLPLDYNYITAKDVDGSVKIFLMFKGGYGLDVCSISTFEITSGGGQVLCLE